MKGHLEFISAPSADTPGTSIVLMFLGKRYFFGQMHEGLSRAGLQQGAKFLKIKDFFLTGRTEWATMGGILGMILSVADGATAAAVTRAENLKEKIERKMKFEEEQRALAALGKKNKKGPATPDLNRYEQEDEDVALRIRSGPNLKHFLACARSFIFRQGIPIEVHEFDGEESSQHVDGERRPDFEDEHIKIWNVPLSSAPRPSSSGSQASDRSRKRSHGEFVQGQKAIGDQSIQNALADGKYVSRGDVVNFVVKEMFQSEWKFNKLTEKPLSEVRPPARCFIRDPRTREVKPYKGPMPGQAEQVPDIQVLVREPWPGALVESLPSTTPSTVSMSYLVKTHRQRGKFLPKEALRLGVPKGRLFNDLVQGKSVKAEDGSTVTPEMVLEPSKEGGGFIVVDLPSPDYLPAFLEKHELQDQTWMTGIQNVIWLLGPRVVNDKTFVTCLDRYKSLQNIISSPETSLNTPAMTSAARSFFVHNHIDADRYPSLSGSSIASETTSPMDIPINGDGSAHVIAQAGLRLEIVPESKVVKAGVVSDIKPSDALKDIPDSILTSSKNTLDDISDADRRRDIHDPTTPEPEAEITCLGTGSMLPSLYRNVSATLLRVPGSGSHLLDCGEDTLGQLKRIYSSSELKDILKDLRVIWISHLHADHHLGTIAVIKAWAEAVHGVNRSIVAPSDKEQEDVAQTLSSGQKLLVISNPQMARFLKEYSSVEDYGYDHIIALECTSEYNVENRSSLGYKGADVGFHSKSTSPLKSQIQAASGLADLRYVRVNHCWGAYAVSLTFPSGFKFSYSGDCRPSIQFAKIGKGSTVLLHEATFDDQLRGEALAKKHSTTSEAIGVGAAMGAKNIILTHFSQRYAKMPVLSNLDKAALRLENVEDAVDDAAEAMDAPVDNLHDAESSQEVSSNTAQNEEHSHRRATSRDGGAAGNNMHDRPSSSPLDPAKMNIGIAFDYMRVKVKDIQHLQKFNHIYQQLYNDDAVRPPSAEGTEYQERMPQKYKHQPKKVKSKQNLTQKTSQTSLGDEKRVLKE